MKLQKDVHTPNFLRVRAHTPQRIGVIHDTK